jgi:hypothetical protein
MMRVIHTKTKPMDSRIFSTGAKGNQTRKSLSHQYAVIDGTIRSASEEKNEIGKKRQRKQNQRLEL